MKEPPTGAARILVVDDESSITDLVAMALRYEQFAVAVAGGGREALEQVESFVPDLVVLDIMMPVLDGWFVLAELGGRATHPSVVVCSAKSGDADRTRASDLGADEYVTKPFEPDDLVDVIRAVLARHRAAV